MNFIFKPFDLFIKGLSWPFFIKDALIDSVHMLPFLVLIFIIVEIIEYKFGHKLEDKIEKSKKAAPFFGALLGCLPQCGFSVIAAALYSRGLITSGTLIAVFLSTSDEAIPVILSQPQNFSLVVELIAVKFLIALIFGYGIDLIAGNFKKSQLCDPNDVICVSKARGCCEHNVGHELKPRQLLIHPLVHTFKIFIFIFVITLGINFIVSLLGGEQNIGRVFYHGSFLQPVITAVFGLIPNCAASVAITLMYLKGGITFGALVSGLCASGGLGLLVLAKENKKLVNTLKIIALLLLISIFCGIIIQLIWLF